MGKGLLGWFFPGPESATVEEGGAIAKPPKDKKKENTWSKNFADKVKGTVKATTELPPDRMPKK